MRRTPRLQAECRPTRECSKVLTPFRCGKEIDESHRCPFTAQGQHGRRFLIADLCADDGPNGTQKKAHRRGRRGAEIAEAVTHGGASRPWIERRPNRKRQRDWEGRLQLSRLSIQAGGQGRRPCVTAENLSPRFGTEPPRPPHLGEPCDWFLFSEKRSLVSSVQDSLTLKETRTVCAVGLASSGPKFSISNERPMRLPAGSSRIDSASRS